MHVPTPERELICDNDTKYQLEKFIAQPEPSEAGPCPGCKLHIPMNCSGQCDEAASSLSITPDRYPIEPRVVALVFEMTASRLMQTCWSCEGHMDNNNNLWKVPQVSFYSESPIYPKLVMIHLSRLSQTKRLTYRWHVVLSDFTLTLGLTYSIQPDLNQEENTRLGLLQQDIQLISEDMHSKLKLIASELLHTYCQ